MLRGPHQLTPARGGGTRQLAGGPPPHIDISGVASQIVSLHHRDTFRDTHMQSSPFYGSGSPAPRAQCPPPRISLSVIW